MCKIEGCKLYTEKKKKKLFKECIFNENYFKTVLRSSCTTSAIKEGHFY